MAAVGGRAALMQRRATAVKKKGVRVVEGKESCGVFCRGLADGTCEGISWNVSG